MTVGRGHENATTIETGIAAASRSRTDNEVFAGTGEWVRRTYRKLHQIAATQMRREPKGHTLSATGLVHEVFLRLSSRDASTWINERQFLAIVASEMRRILVDAARKKKSVKRGGTLVKRKLESYHAPHDAAEVVVDLYEAIDEFEKVAPEKAELVRLRYFLGLSEVEAAATMGISRATASRHWTFARAWLLDYVARHDETATPGAVANLGE